MDLMGKIGLVMVIVAATLFLGYRIGYQDGVLRIDKSIFYSSPNIVFLNNTDDNVYVSTTTEKKILRGQTIPYGTIITCPECRKELYKCISTFANHPQAADYEPIGDTPPPIQNTRTLCPFCKAELWGEFQKHLRRYE